MARYGIIENDKVKDIIIADAEFAESYEHDLILLEDDLIKIGYNYVDGVFSYIKPAITEEQAKIWRDSELQTTDNIAQTPDYPNRDAWITYRQELRDWPSTADFPETKPTKPE
tara:strand:- start:169 stop:507 length:339 start_codon:yes stop_codon:yes gene_type:complete